MISLRSIGLLWQLCCSHRLYQEDHHVCLEQTSCCNFVRIVCGHADNLPPEYNSRGHKHPQGPYNRLDRDQLYWFDSLGFCLDDRSSAHAREELLGLACPIRSSTPSDADAICTLPPASHTELVIGCAIGMLITTRFLL